MFLYHVRICSFVTSGSARVLSSIIPAEFMTRYVGIGGSFEGVRKSIVVTRGLPTAPGKRGLFDKLSVWTLGLRSPFVYNN